MIVTCIIVVLSWLYLSTNYLADYVKGIQHQGGRGTLYGLFTLPVTNPWWQCEDIWSLVTTLSSEVFILLEILFPVELVTLMGFRMRIIFELALQSLHGFCLHCINFWNTDNVSSKEPIRCPFSSSAKWGCFFCWRSHSLLSWRLRRGWVSQQGQL